MIRALVFDFDGLILETETPIFQSWQELYREYGQELSFETWAKIIGTADTEYEPLRALEELLGALLERQAVEARRLQRETELVQEQPVLPGVEQYLQDAHRLGLKVGLASSSPCSWVQGHLTRLGLLDYFDAIRASDDVERTKPDPALYTLAVQGLGVSPGQAIALEDSPNGLLAARRAGLFCVAVPNDLTRSLALEQADMQLASLAHMPLETLLVEVEARLDGRG
ncbi:MAG: HAD family hydrolase [Chloroflexota bacterium]